MKKNSELTYKEMYRQPASFQAVNDTLEDIFKTLDSMPSSFRERHACVPA